MGVGGIADCLSRIVFYRYVVRYIMTSPARTLSIAQTRERQDLSPGQKKFNTLIKKIEVQRKLLQAWQESIPLVQQRYAGEFVPLLKTFEQESAETARLLDQRFDKGGLGKGDRETLQMAICDLVVQLVHGDDGPEMRALFDKHSAVDFETTEKEAAQSFKAMAEDAFGLDLGDDDGTDSPEELMRRLQEQMQAREQKEPPEPQKARKPTARQLRQQAEDEKTSKSIRDVYRALASALHPDREPDPEERVRKTGLMQQVNQAYARKDLLGLLQLQLEVEQIDQNAINTMAEGRLKHFNKVLTEQLRELQDEILGVEEEMRMNLSLDPYERISPANIMKAFLSQVQRLQYDIYQLQAERQRMADATGLKRWLKQERARRRQTDAMFGDPYNFF